MKVFSNKCKYTIAFMTPIEHTLQILADYRQRWGSIRDEVYLINSINELRDTSYLFAPIGADIGNLFPNRYTLTNSLYKAQIRSVLLNPQYESTDDWDIFMHLVSDINGPIACDFETTGLHIDSEILMLSLAYSDSQGIVFIVSNEDNMHRLLKWLIDTNLHQIWHNTLFDFKFIYKYTNSLPKSYDDSMLMWATILNNVDKEKRQLSLKHLAKTVYKDWGVNAKLFTKDNLYNKDLIKYCALDSMATFYLWEEAKLRL
jgi:hypothetical protein